MSAEAKRDMIQVTMDGQVVEVAPGTTILAAAKQAGIAIPALCHSPMVEPYGVCRVCSVEIATGRRRRVVTACNYPLQRATEVWTRSERVQRVRRLVLEMLLARWPNVKVLQELGREAGLEAPRFVHPRRNEDPHACILCGLCVRASELLDGKSVLAIAGHGTQARLVVDSPSGHLGDSRIAATDHAASVCPVGALLPKRRGFETPIGQRRYDLHSVADAHRQEATAPGQEEQPT